MNKKKIIILFGFPMLLIVIGVTYAFLIDRTPPVNNEFRAASVYTPVIVEDFTTGNLIKRNVKVSMAAASYQSYIRAKVIVNWQDDDGNVLAISPESGVDYSITYMLGNWLLATDGYYYYKAPVNGETDVLISEASVLKKAPKAGYKLNIEILAQAVQSVPSNAVVDSWGVILDQNGNINVS